MLFLGKSPRGQIELSPTKRKHVGALVDFSAVLVATEITQVPYRAQLRSSYNRVRYLAG